MTDPAGLDLLVATGSQSFTETVSENLRTTGMVHEITIADSAGTAIAQAKDDSVDGVVIDDRLEEPVTTIRRLTAIDSTAVVLLTQGEIDAQGIETALDEGAIDLFPRTTASQQYELVAERIRSEQEAVTAGGSEACREEINRREYREIFENVSDGLVIHDPETGEIVDVNEQFCALNEYDRDELVGESIGLVTAPGDEYDEQAAREMIEQARQDGPQLFEWRNQRKGGETFPVEVHLALIQVGGQEYVLASVRDITERKTRERQRQESERRFRLIAEHIDEIIYLSSADFSDIQYINAAYEEIYGEPVEKLYENPRSFVEAAHPDDRERYEQDIERLVEDIESNQYDNIYDGQYRLQRDGETRWVNVARFPVENDDGTVDRIVGRVQDVTERQQIERRLRTILERIDEAIYFTPAEQLTDPSLAPDDFYSGYDDVWGQPLEEIFEQYEDGFFGTLHPDERPGFRSFIADIGGDLESGRLSDRYTREYRIERADGELRWIRSVFYPTEWGSGPPRILIVSRDITERKRREREYEQIFNSVQDAIAVHDPQTGELVNVNETFCDLVGYDREMILDMGTAGVSVGSEGYTEEYAAEIIAEVMRDGQKGPFEWMVETKDGEHRVTEVVATKGEIHGEERIISINRDVTERERRRREFEQIFDGVIDPIAVYDPETLDILDANEAFLELVNQEDLATLREQDLEDLMVTEEGFTVERAREIHQRIIETGEPETFDWKGRNDEGEDLWLEVKVTPAEIGGDTVTIASHRNITERRRREQEYEQIFNGVKDAILVIEPETLEILDANETYLDLVGYDDLKTIQELGLEGMLIAQDGSTIEQGRELHEQVAKTGESKLVEWRAETSEGDRLWLEVEVAPATINGEQVNIAIHRDVTERRHLERRFRTIGERVDEVIYYSNIDLNEVLYMNDSYTDIWGRPVEEIYEDPRAFVESIHPDDVEEFRENRQSMLADIKSGDPDDSYDFSYRIERPDGELRWIESTGYPIVGDGAEPNRYVAMVEDVTEQRRREQTLETFHEATRKLTSADSHQKACQQAVQAAQDVLGFPLVAAYLYDEETGTLEPAAVTDRLETLDADLQSFAPGDSVPWQVYVEGESRASPDQTTTIYAPGISPPDIVVPLGSHGVMFVGAPDEAFDSEDIELAQILAATLEAALNHLAGEQTLAEREEELKRQQERAAQLEQLNTIIRDIEQATVEQSSRSGIESAVCDRLLDVEPHDLVWIGTSAVSDDELSIQTSAGDKREYIDALSTELASETAGHPVLAAHRHSEARTVENIATDVSPGDWRTLALRHGIQSVITVPIQYETTVHGVLTVASEEPDAFDKATREVLVELGCSIGYAITVTEREAALESEGTTELEFDTADDGLFMIRGSDRTNSEIQLERTVRRSGGSFSIFYRVDGVEPSDVVELATAAPSVERAQVISSDDEEPRGLLDVTAPTWFGSVFTEHGAIVREATAENGSGEIVVEAPRGADVRSLVEGFQERYPDSDLAAQRQRERTIRSLFELQDILREQVTDRQWEALETAYSAGYFAWPRETSGEEVAELIGVTQPTFNKHLRTAEQAAFQLLLEREPPDTGN
jgi:PAS domain S-box-containing protein